MMVMKKILVLLAALPLVSGCYCSSGRKGVSAISDRDVIVLSAVSLGEDGFYRNIPRRNVIEFPETDYSHNGEDWVFWLLPEKGHAKPPINGYFTKVIEEARFDVDGCLEKEWRRYEFVVTDVITTDGIRRLFPPDGEGMTPASDSKVYEVHARAGGSWLLDPMDYPFE